MLRRGTLLTLGGATGGLLRPWSGGPLFRGRGGSARSEPQHRGGWLRWGTGWAGLGSGRRSAGGGWELREVERGQWEDGICGGWEAGREDGAGLQLLPVKRGGRYLRVLLGGGAGEGEEAEEGPVGSLPTNGVAPLRGHGHDFPEALTPLGRPLHWGERHWCGLRGNRSHAYPPTPPSGLGGLPTHLSSGTAYRGRSLLQGWRRGQDSPRRGERQWCSLRSRRRGRRTGAARSPDWESPQELRDWLPLRVRAIWDFPPAKGEVPPLDGVAQRTVLICQHILHQLPLPEVCRPPLAMIMADDHPRRVPPLRPPMLLWQLQVGVWGVSPHGAEPPPPCSSGSKPPPGPARGLRR